MFALVFAYCALWRYEALRQRPNPLARALFETTIYVVFVAVIHVVYSAVGPVYGLLSMVPVLAATSLVEWGCAKLKTRRATL